MTDIDSSQSLAPAFSAHIQAFLDRGQVSVQLATHMQFLEDLADMMQARHLTYLELPPLLVSVAASPIYGRALCYGRGWYFDAMHTVDEQGKVVRDPLTFDRPEIFEMVKDGICPQDKRLLFQPIAWRVGFVVGWLSALAISQRDDAESAMIILSALVAPLLVDQPETKPTKNLETKHKKASCKPARTSSHKQSKKR